MGQFFLSFSVLMIWVFETNLRGASLLWIRGELAGEGLWLWLLALVTGDTRYVRGEGGGVSKEG